MELNKILSDGRWGDMAALVNANFEKIKVELMKLRFSSILTFCKGYFFTEARLVAKYPKGKTGEYAFVGIPWPGTVWEWIDTKWVDSGVAPQLGDSVFMELLKRHIDNKTILWDDGGQYIYSLGGGGGSSFAITVSMDASSAGKCKVEATGDVVSVVPSSDGGSYVVAGTTGGTVKVKIIPDTGYEIAAVTVDNESKGAVSEYVFNKLSANHSMSVRVAVIDEVATDFLVRSDLPGSYYSSTQDALDAVKAAYPDGLTRDVTISCVKGATEKRNSGVWLASLTNWNKNSVYMLTIDGAEKLAYDCKSGGGLRFEHVDNIVMQNIDFLNYGNGVEFITPDELAAIAFIGDAQSYSLNLYVDNCRLNGTSTSKPDKMSNYSIITKNAENVYLVNNRIEGCYAIPLKMVDCRWLSLVKNYVKADNSSGIIGHPALCTLSNGYGIIAEDNEFTGNTGEYFFYLTNVGHIIFRRNVFRDGGGEALNITSKESLKELVLESNLFVNMLAAPSMAWSYSYVTFSCNADRVDVLNNTAYMCGIQWQQWFMRSDGTHIGTVNVCNNIIINATAGKVPMRGFALGTIDTINSGNNIYQVPLKSEGVAAENIFLAAGLTKTNSLVELQAQGIEQNTVLVSTDVKLLEVQNGGTSYKLLDSLEYYSNEGHVPFADIDYKKKAATGNVRGCYNRNGTLVDESGDNTSGYTGEDFDESGTFSNTVQYSTLAESMLLFRHNTPDRSRFIKLSAVGTQHRALIAGRYGILSVNPELDEHGDYIRDELYDINIE